MSNNDLWCKKCNSQHHPVECPAEQMNAKESKELTKMEEIKELHRIQNKCGVLADIFQKQFLTGTYHAEIAVCSLMNLIDSEIRIRGLK